MRKFLLTHRAARWEMNTVFFLYGIATAAILGHIFYEVPSTGAVLLIPVCTMGAQATLNLVRHTAREEDQRGRFPSYDVVCVMITLTAIITMLSLQGDTRTTLMTIWFVAGLIATGGALHEQANYQPKPGATKTKGADLAK